MPLKSSTDDLAPVDEKAGAILDPAAEEIERENNARFYTIDPDEERKVVRKLDMVIMPLMVLVYFFQCRSFPLSWSLTASGARRLHETDLDKQSINQAAIFGLRDDLSLTGLEFSWAVSLFYVGQLVSEWPAMFLLSRLPITIYVGVTIVIWGGVNMCMAVVHNFQGLAAARFFLGFAEGKNFYLYQSNYAC